MFTKNEGVIDRDLRVLGGAALLYLAVFVVHGVWGFVVGALALVLFATAVAGFCPLYAILRVNTCSPTSEH